MIESVDGRLTVRCAMVMDNASALLAAGRAVISPGAVFDLGDVTEADSSALAVMLGWQREAAARDIAIGFAGVPVGVRSLAGLYGVNELLSLA